MPSKLILCATKFIRQGPLDLLTDPTLTLGPGNIETNLNKTEPSIIYGPHFLIKSFLISCTPMASDITDAHIGNAGASLLWALCVPLTTLCGAYFTCLGLNRSDIGTLKMLRLFVNITFFCQSKVFTHVGGLKHK